MKKLSVIMAAAVLAVSLFTGAEIKKHLIQLVLCFRAQIMSRQQ